MKKETEWNIFYLKDIQISLRRKRNQLSKIKIHKRKKEILLILMSEILKLDLLKSKTKVKDIALNQLYPLTRKNWRKIK